MQKTNRYLIALVAALGLIPVVLDTTIVTVALTPIRTNLRTDVNTIQWIVTGYFLANAAIVTVGGYLANRFGRKRLFVLGIAIFTLGSVLSGISPGIGWLIAFRVLQGIGGGILLPIGPALAFDAFPQEERARASAVVGIPLMLAPVFGPIIGGYLNDTFHWNSIFFVNVPIGLIAAAAALVVLPLDKPGEARGVRFDSIGLALSTIGIIAVVYALKLVTQTNPATVTATNPSGDLYGWGYWPVWVLLGAGVVVLLSFAFYALRLSRNPALDLRQFKQRDFLVSNLFNWAAVFINFGLLVLLPLYFEAVRLPTLSPFDTGLALVPFGLGALAGTIVSTALYRATGPRWVVFIGATLSALSAWLLAQTIQPTANAGQLFATMQTQTTIPAVAGLDALRWGIFLAGLSLGLVIITVQTVALEALKGEALAKAESLFLSTRFIFASIGVAIITTLFVDRTRLQATNLANQLLALGQGSGINLSNPRVLARYRVIEAQIPTQAGTWAIQSIFWLIFFGSLGLVVLALLLPGRRRPIVAVPSEREPIPGSSSWPRAEEQLKQQLSNGRTKVDNVAASSQNQPGVE